MNRFAELLDRLAYEPGRNNKLRLITRFLKVTPDPDRGWALAALTGALSFKHAKPALIRALIASRVDPELFRMSYDYVGDLSETVALMWPVQQHVGHNNQPPPTLSEVVEMLGTLGKSELPAQLARWLDELDETGRWALLKLVTGSMRIGVSARLAKTAAAALGKHPADAVELIWPGLTAPYSELFGWLEGRTDKPVNLDPAPFRPVMLAHGIADTDFPNLDPADFVAEWKWDGIRVQAVCGPDPGGHIIARLYSRTGEDISPAFPDLIDVLGAALPHGISGFAIDGELLVLREGRVQSFNVLQQRLNRKTVTPKLTREFPVHIRAYDLLSNDGNDLRDLTFTERREQLTQLVSALNDPRIDLSDQIVFDSWERLGAARSDPVSAGASADADAVEGVMLKRRDSLYLPGRPKGQWWKWKRDPHIVDCVLMYAQRGHGKRSSYYSDYTFGVWTATDSGDQLIPVGKAYFGFTDEELIQIDRFVRRHTTEKFGPVRHVVHEPDKGLVFEVAFEGLARSPRHKSGVAMRFPRISRLRWDKPPREADRLETLERMLKPEPIVVDAAAN